MKREIISLMLICLLVIVTGCGNPTKNTRITEKNKDTVFEQIGKSKDLTADEVRMLMAYIMKDSMASSFSGSKPSYIGKTIGEIIKEEGKIEKDAQKLAEEAQKEEEKNAKELSSVIAVAAYNKGFASADWSSGNYDNYVNLSLVIKNVSTKDVRAFKGKLVIEDLFGGLIENYGFDYDKTLKSGQEIKGAWRWKYNQFDDNDQKIKNTALENLKITWQPEAVIFSDGTKIGRFEE